MHLRQTIKITIRNFRNNFSISLIKILGLSVSILVVMTIWSFIINENKYDSGIKDSDRIYRLDAHWASMPPFIGNILNQSMGTQFTTTRLNFWTDIGVQVDNNPFNLPDLLFADSTFFKVFAFDFISGNPEDALVRPFSIVLTESVAKKLFGTTDINGRILKFENLYDFTVTGVIKDLPYLHLKIDLVASLRSLETIRFKGVLEQYDGWSFPTYLKLPVNSQPARYELEIQELLKKFGYDQTFKLQPFNKIYYSSEIENESNTKHGNLLYNRILIAISVFILLLALVNFINLTIASAISRYKEVSLRKVNGASRSMIVFQFLTETFLFISVSFFVAFIVIWFFNPLISDLTGFTFSLSDFFSSVSIISLISGIVLFTIISGLYPSLYISKGSLITEKQRPSGFSKTTSLRNILIIFQNFVSITLILCTLIANSQFRYMKKKDLGFNMDNIVILKVNSQMKDHMDFFKEKILKIAGIENMSYSSRLPGNYWGSWCCVNIEGHENKYFNNYVDADYLRTMGIKLVEGRDFSAESQSDLKTTYLINQYAVNQYNLNDPVGQVITPGNGVKGTIIGIIKDFHYRGLNYEMTPLLLFYTSGYLNYVNIRLAPGDITGELQKIMEVWKEVCSAFAFEYNFLNDSYDMQYRSERKFESLLFAFALFALFIASIGLYGLSKFSAQRRTKEIGIRKVNGSSILEIMVMQNMNYLRWVIAALVLSCPLAVFSMKKWLTGFAYRTEIHWWIFVIGGLIALLIAVMSISIVSWKAATRNPVEALRYE